jgi:hypothetical protein
MNSYVKFLLPVAHFVGLFLCGALVARISPEIYNNYPSIYMNWDLSGTWMQYFKAASTIYL